MDNRVAKCCCCAGAVIGRLRELCIIFGDFGVAGMVFGDFGDFGVVEVIVDADMVILLAVFQS